MLETHIRKLQGKRITVIGDIMLDRYLWGSVSRISPEAPVPVVLMEKETYVPGGAANTATNVAALGGACMLIGVVGIDEAAKKLSASVEAHDVVSVLIKDPARPTIQKTRVMGNRQQIIRLDKEDKQSIGARTEEELIAAVKNSAAHTDVFVISDYAKGSLSDHVIAAVHETARQKKIPLVCDGKPANKAWFSQSTIITPNRKEAYAMAGLPEKSSVEQVGRKLVSDLNCAVLITLAERGMMLFERGGMQHAIPTTAREVFDVSGAGDTAVAALALALAAGAPLLEACTLANHAAGIVVAKLGTASASIDELLAATRITGG